MATNGQKRNADDEPTGPPERDAIRDALSTVTDPELDRSIVELEYIDEITVERDGDAASVSVAFTLPTAWCSPAFAWMMATDARDVVEALSGVADCEVELREHMHTEEINSGVNERRSFEASFPDADDGIAGLRATLDEKARMARQYDAVEALLDAGLAGAQIATLRRDDLERLDDDRLAVYVRDGNVGVTVAGDAVERYRRKARDVDLFEESERLFRTPEEDLFDPEDFELVHNRGRLAQVNMDGQGGVCDALHDARREQLGD